MADSRPEKKPIDWHSPAARIANRIKQTKYQIESNWIVNASENWENDILCVCYPESEMCLLWIFLVCVNLLMMGVFSWGGVWEVWTG